MQNEDEFYYFLYIKWIFLDSVKVSIFKIQIKWINHMNIVFKDVC